MPTLISSSKTENRSSKGSKNTSSQGGTATLSSPTAQLFSDGFFDEENKQDNGTLAIKSKSSFGNADIPNNNTSGVKQLKSSPSFPAIQPKSINQPVQRVANTSQPVQLNSWWNRNAPSWLWGSEKNEKLDAIGGGLKTTGKVIGAGVGGAVGAGLGAVGGGIFGAGMGAYQGATGAFSEAKEKAGGGIMGTIAGLGAGLMGGIGGLISGGAAGAVGGAGYGALAGGKLGSGNAKGAGNSFNDFIDGGLYGGDKIHEGAKGFGKGVGMGASGIGAVGGGLIGAGIGVAGGAVGGALSGAFTGAKGAYNSANKSAGGGWKGKLAGLGAGLIGGIGGLFGGGASGAVGGAMSGAEAGKNFGSNQFGNSPNEHFLKPNAQKSHDNPANDMSLAERAKYWVKGNRATAAGATASAGLSIAKLATQGGLSLTEKGAMVGGIGGLVTGTATTLKGMSDFYRGRKKANKSKESLKTTKIFKDAYNQMGFKAGRENIRDQRVKDRLEQTAGKDMKREGVYGTISGALSTAAGATMVSGVAAPVGLGLGLASAAVSGVGALHGMKVQNGRDKEARRMRTQDEILNDKIQKNRDREDRVAGSIFNPLNWSAKFNRSTGRDEKDKFRDLGLNKDMNKDEDASKEYIKSKRDKYQEEGYDYSNFKDSAVKKGSNLGDVDEVDIDSTITKTEKTGGSWMPWKWGEGGKNDGEKTTLDAEEIMVKRELHSKKINERKNEEIKKKGWFDF